MSPPGFMVLPCLEPCASGRSFSRAARLSPLTLRPTALLIKESVNQTIDNMGFYNALHACFTLHELNHAHWTEVHEDGYPVGRVEDGLGDWRKAPPVLPAVKNAVGGQVR